MAATTTIDIGTLLQEAVRKRIEDLVTAEIEIAQIRVARQISGVVDRGARRNAEFGRKPRGNTWPRLARQRKQTIAAPPPKKRRKRA